MSVASEVVTAAVASVGASEEIQRRIGEMLDAMDPRPDPAVVGFALLDAAARFHARALVKEGAGDALHGLGLSTLVESLTALYEAARQEAEAARAQRLDDAFARGHHSGDAS